MLQEVFIRPASGGFGQYECQRDRAGEKFISVQDMLPAHNFIDLDDEADLPDGVEDIRGRVRDEPDHIYAVSDGRGGWYYVGADEVDD